VELGSLFDISTCCTACNIESEMALTVLLLILKSVECITTVIFCGKSI